MSYDIIIVGAGIAGLRVGIETLNKYPHASCCILEKYNYNGGRVFTYKHHIKYRGNVQWESGAGRIATSHKRVRKLLDKYKLTFLPIESITQYIDKDTTVLTHNNFSELHAIYLSPLEYLPQDILQTHTLYELLSKVIGIKKSTEFFIKFPYYAEVYTLRADIALMSFRTEMGPSEKFGICKEGLSSITDHMANDFIKRGGTILHDIELTEIQHAFNSVTLECKDNKRFVTKRCVLALHSDAIRIIKGVSHLPVLRKLKTMPLTRMYAVFPTHKGTSWFSGLTHIVTNDSIRYIIPINASKGIIMISYTDGNDSCYWSSVKQVESTVMHQIRQLFPTLSIPNPLFFKVHTWNTGCTYWIPGKYDVEKESIASLHPMPHLFMCGESFSVKQAWIESALEQADKLLHLNAFHHALESM